MSKTLYMFLVPATIVSMSSGKAFSKTVAAFPFSM